MTIKITTELKILPVIFIYESGRRRPRGMLFWAQLKSFLSPSVRLSVPYFLAVSAPRELIILILARDNVSAKSTAGSFNPLPGSAGIGSWTWLSPNVLNVLNVLKTEIPVLNITKNGVCLEADPIPGLKYSHLNISGPMHYRKMVSLKL
jgi:hypothetical protein